MTSAQAGSQRGELAVLLHEISRRPFDVVLLAHDTARWPHRSRTIRVFGDRDKHLSAKKWLKISE